MAKNDIVFHGYATHQYPLSLSGLTDSAVLTFFKPWTLVLSDEIDVRDLFIDLPDNSVYFPNKYDTFHQ